MILLVQVTGAVAEVMRMELKGAVYCDLVCSVALEDSEAKVLPISCSESL